MVCKGSARAPTLTTMDSGFVDGLASLVDDARGSLDITRDDFDALFDDKPIFDDYEFGGPLQSSPRARSASPEQLRLDSPRGADALPEWASPSTSAAVGVRVRYWRTLLAPFLPTYGAPFVDATVPAIIDELPVVDVRAADLFGNAAPQLARESRRQIETYALDRLVDLSNALRYTWPSADLQLTYVVRGVLDAIVLLRRRDAQSAFRPTLLSLDALGAERRVLQSTVFSIQFDMQQLLYLRSMPAAPGADDQALGPAGHVIGVLYNQMIDRAAPVQAERVLDVRARIDALERVEPASLEASRVMALFFEMTLANPSAQRLVRHMLREVSALEGTRTTATDVKNYFSTEVAPRLARDTTLNVFDWPTTTIYSMLVRIFLALRVDGVANLSVEQRKQLADAFVITSAALAKCRARPPASPAAPAAPLRKGQVVDI